MSNIGQGQTLGPNGQIIDDQQQLEMEEGEQPGQMQGNDPVNVEVKDQEEVAPEEQMILAEGAQVQNQNQEPPAVVTEGQN